MRLRVSRWSAGIVAALILLFAAVTQALKFDIAAHPGSESAAKERCIRNFVAKDQLVVVTAVVSGNKGDGMQLNMHVRRRILSRSAPARRMG